MRAAPRTARLTYACVVCSANDVSVSASAATAMETSLMTSTKCLRIAMRERGARGGGLIGSSAAS
jgi:hypothetical protein